ncbi:MAG: T9SS type A sorting domain-containing protein [Rhodothermales bacterium]
MPGPSGEWDRGGLIAPTVIQDGDTLKMWYFGLASLNNPSSYAIGYAWSLDGVGWTKHPGNPVMTDRPGEWDAPGVSVPVVIKDGDTYRMWYSGSGCPDDGSIGYATSTDGLTWERLPAPVMERGPAGEWNVDFLSPGSVIEEDGLFKMWFFSGTGTVCSNTPATRASTGYATSPDGITWTLYDDPATTDPPYQFSDPVLEPGPSGAWDTNYAFSSYVLSTGTGYELWYSGRRGSEQDIGYATSPDGITWTKYAGNPVFEAPAWAPGGLVYPSVLRDGDTYRMWVQGWQNNSASIGYATAPLAVSAEPGATPSGMGALHPAYPNPAAVGTTISYTLEQPAHVTLAVYELLGRPVAHLVDAVRPAGASTLAWDGRDGSGRRLGTGVYVVRLHVNGETQSRKVLLLR